MRTELYNLISAWYYALSIVIQLAVGVIIWLYTSETRKIRKDGEGQLHLLRLQSQRSVAPCLFSGFRTREIGSFGRACAVWNPTDRLAHDISVFVFDGVAYFSSLRCIDTLRQADQTDAEDIQANGPVSAEIAFERVLMNYPDCPQKILERLRDHQKSFIGVLYRDINGLLYLAVRAATFDEARNSQLIDRNFILYPK